MEVFFPLWLSYLVLAAQFDLANFSLTLLFLFLNPSWDAPVRRVAARAGTLEDFGERRGVHHDRGRLGRADAVGGMIL